MVKTHLDQITDYPAKIMRRIAEDKFCTGLLLNKSFDEVNKEDVDFVLQKNIKDYQILDDTMKDLGAYVWVETDVERVENSTIKVMYLYVSVACHKDHMSLDGQLFNNIIGNRRDNIVRHVDKVLNNCESMGIGKLKIHSVKTVEPINGYAIRELIYEISDFI